jgi:hypothetical protein
MALYMQNNRSTWDPGNKVNLLATWPTAGPTPGNDVFAGYYQSLVNGSSFAYTAKYNTLDAVPHAWELDMLIQIPFLYDASFKNPTTPPDAMVASIVSGVVMNTYNQSALSFIKYQQVFVGDNSHFVPMTGSYKDPLLINAKLAGALNLIPTLYRFNKTLNGSKVQSYLPFFTNFGFFVLQMLYQHTEAYNAPEMLNIQSFSDNMKKILDGIAPAAIFAAQEEAVAAAVERYLGIPGLALLEVAPELAAEASVAG